MTLHSCAATRNGGLDSGSPLRRRCTPIDAAIELSQAVFAMRRWPSQTLPCRSVGLSPPAADFAIEYTDAISAVATSEYVMHTRLLAQAEG